MYLLCACAKQLLSLYDLFLFLIQYYIPTNVKCHVVLDVYERLIQKGKKPGFLQLLATQTVSAIWHVSIILPFHITSITVVYEM